MSDVVWGADAMAPDKVMVMTSPTPLTQESAAGTIADLGAYEAALDRGC
jgi:hypothetical protein